MADLIKIRAAKWIDSALVESIRVGVQYGGNHTVLLALRGEKPSENERVAEFPTLKEANEFAEDLVMRLNEGRRAVRQYESFDLDNV